MTKLVSILRWKIDGVEEAIEMAASALLFVALLWVSWPISSGLERAALSGSGLMVVCLSYFLQESARNFNPGSFPYNPRLTFRWVSRIGSLIIVFLLIGQSVADGNRSLFMVTVIFGYIIPRWVAIPIVLKVLSFAYNVI